MRPTSLLGLLMAVLFVALPVKADPFWIDLEDGRFIVGYVGLDPAGTYRVSQAWVYDPPTLTPIPGCDGPGATAGDAANTPFFQPEPLPRKGLCEMFTVEPLDEEFDLLVVFADFPPTEPDNTPPGRGGGPGTDPTDDTSNGTGDPPPDGDNGDGGTGTTFNRPIESFVAIMLRDLFGDWGSFLYTPLSFLLDQIQPYLNFVEGGGGGVNECDPPPDSGEPVSHPPAEFPMCRVVVRSGGGGQQITMSCRAPLQGCGGIYLYPDGPTGPEPPTGPFDIVLLPTNDFLFVPRADIVAPPVE